MSELPQGWARTNVGDVADISSGFGFPERFQGKASGDLPFAKVRDISYAHRNNRGRLVAADNYVTRAELLDLKARPAPAGSTAFAKIGEALRLNRRVLLEVDTVLDNNCMAVTGNKQAVEPEFLYQFMTTVDLSPFAVATTVPSVRRGDVEGIELHLPPLPEQRRIVAKIDSLTGKSRRVRDHLDHIPRLVERYKQAVLAAAFRGDLTREWRHQEAMTDYDIDAFGPWPIPARWSWKAVADVGKVSLGRQRSPANHSGPHMHRYVRAANITWKGWDLSDVKEMNFDERDFARFRLQNGDVLVNEGSGSAKEVGKPAIWNGEIAECCFQNTLIRVQPRDCSSKYLYWYFLFSALTEKFVSSTQGVNIYHIGKDGLARFPIPHPTADEQEAIVQKIETTLAWIDRLASEVTSARRLIDRLDQAVIAKAFRGELVPQDPADEPASVLLERIRAERAATAPKAKRGRKINPASQAPAVEI